MKLALYNIDVKYIDYLSPSIPHLFHNKQAGQKNERKYIGIVLSVNGFEYFAPLSSFKPKHYKMAEMIDFIKVKNYAVINLNNMFPVPDGVCSFVDINAEADLQYKSLLQAEYRYIKSIQEKIMKNAANIYKHKIQNGNSTGLSKRTNDFMLLEKLCKEYKNIKK